MVMNPLARTKKSPQTNQNSTKPETSAKSSAFMPRFANFHTIDESPLMASLHRCYYWIPSSTTSPQSLWLVEAFEEKASKNKQKHMIQVIQSDFFIPYIVGSHLTFAGVT